MMIGAIIFGFCLLALVYYNVEQRKLEVYERAQKEWREMEKELYKVNSPPDTTSPYYISQSHHSKTNKLGFSVKDNRTGAFAGDNGWHKWFETSYAAWTFMNELELIGHFDLTDLGLPEPPKKTEQELRDEEEERKKEEEAA